MYCTAMERFYVEFSIALTIQPGLGSKPTRAILLCPWKRHFTALFPAWWSWQAVLNYSYTSIKLQTDSNISGSRSG